MTRTLRALAATLAAVALLAPAHAPATTIDALLFEELVLGADFVGVVECTTAGGIVAEYTVVESWKGPKAGTRVVIRLAVNYWEPQFPIALCSERYFVTAYKEAPSRVLSTTGGGGVPLWWRDLPADYRLPLFQGRQLLAPGEEKGAEFGKTRAAAQALLALKPAGQEAALLKAVIEKDLFGRKWLGGEPDEAKAKALKDRLAALADADSLAGELLGLATADREKWAVRVGIVLGKAGGAATLARLEKLQVDQSPWDKEGLTALVAEIKERRGLAPAPPPAEKARPDKGAAPDAGELDRLRKAVAGGLKAEGFGEAFETLTRLDPGPVAEFLAGWKNPNADWQDADQGYFLGSYFAWKCGADRAKHLAALSKAADPFVRVAGAVYLCFEDPDAGTAALKKLTALDGDPGAWVALTLARRGDKAAVSRALEVFRERPADREARAGMAGVPHGNLQKRVLVLLSNSAKAGGEPQPALPKADGERFEYMAGWWKKHGAKSVLLDPWLKALEKQKVD